MRWGNRDTWIVMTPKPKEALSVKCSVQVLEDVLPGDDGKHCDCEVLPGSDFERGLNPMWLESEPPDAPLVASCALWAASRSTVWGQQQWQATQAFCGPQDDLPVAGERALSVEVMQKLMEARVDRRFREVYQRHFGSGWAPRAFLNYFAGPPEGKHAKMTLELIRSVHLFSKELSLRLLSPLKLEALFGASSRLKSMDIVQKARRRWKKRESRRVS